MELVLGWAKARDDLMVHGVSGINVNSFTGCREMETTLTKFVGGVVGLLVGAAVVGGWLGAVVGAALVGALVGEWVGWSTPQFTQEHVNRRVELRELQPAYEELTRKVGSKVVCELSDMYISSPFQARGVDLP